MFGIGTGRQCGLLSLMFHWSFILKKGLCAQLLTCSTPWHLRYVTLNTCSVRATMLQRNTLQVFIPPRMPPLKYTDYRNYCGPHYWAYFHEETLGTILWVHNIYEPTVLTFRGPCCRSLYFYWIEDSQYLKDFQPRGIRWVYHMGRTSVTRVAHCFHMQWCVLWGTLWGYPK